MLWFGHALGESKRFIPKIHGCFMQDIFITKCLEFQCCQLTLRYCLFCSSRSQTCFVAWINFGYCFFALIKTNSCWMNHSHILPSFFSSFCSGLKTMGLLLATLVKDGHKINRSCVLLHFPVKNFHQLWVWWIMHSSDNLWAMYLKRKF